MMLNGFGIFIVLIVLLLISWSLVTFWQRFIENLFYHTFGFNQDNTGATLLAAIISTSFFFLIVWLIKISGLIPNIDILIYDYNEEVIIGGSIESRTKSPRRFTGRISPRGSLFLEK